jgi:hypothetical protein
MKRSTPAVALEGPLVALLLLCGVVSAQTTKVSGLITGRKGSNMTLQTIPPPSVVCRSISCTVLCRSLAIFVVRPTVLDVVRPTFRP